MVINVNASEFGLVNTPSPCEKRLFLEGRQLVKLAPGAFEELLQHLGELHEQAQYKKLIEKYGPALDLSDSANGIEQTLQAIANGINFIFQPTFEVVTEIKGNQVKVHGRPDFLVYEDGNYIILDAKIARNLEGKKYDHIRKQMGVYEWLFSKACSMPVHRMDVIKGDGKIEALQHMDDNTVLRNLRDLVILKTTDVEPFEPVGWSKCQACGFKEKCWDSAVENHDVAILIGINQKTASILDDEGITTYEQLLEYHDVSSLADIKLPWGDRERRVGPKDAEKAIRNAKALIADTYDVFAEIELPKGPNWVMFDLEGIPPQLDELDKIYLWGMQVFGKTKGDFRAAVAELGDGSDRLVWEEFLKIADEIMTQFPGISFVHWHSYEKTYINKYIKRFGDVRGIAQRVLDSLFDLLPVTRNAVALPLPSYSLKVVEKYVGFNRELDMKGDVSIAAYVKAVESGSCEGYVELMKDILQYNEEDLAATWAVLTWLQERKEEHRVSH